ncbi:MAG: substrate-binding domain-containing protein, partial [Dehalococcoidia bacterium]
MLKKNPPKWLIIPVVVLSAAILLVSGCGESTTSTTTTPNSSPTDTELSGSFNIIGSNTVTPLTAVWAEEFMNLHPEVSIAVSGPGSGAGIAALINGTTDVCQASRGIRQTEIDQANDAGVNPYEIQVATDALSVIVHPSNPVSEITIAQLSAIYTNK